MHPCLPPVPPPTRGRTFKATACAFCIFNFEFEQALLILPPPAPDATAMLDGKKVIVVMPAYNAAKTLLQTYNEVMHHGFVDRVIVVDDASRDETMAIAK